jgi:hypothetical protein
LFLLQLGWKTAWINQLTCYHREAVANLLFLFHNTRSSADNYPHLAHTGGMNEKWAQRRSNLSDIRPVYTTPTEYPLPPPTIFIFDPQTLQIISNSFEINACG